MRKLIPLFLAFAMLVGVSACTSGSVIVEAAAAGTSTTPEPESTEAPDVDVLVAGDSLAAGGPWDALPNDPGSWTYFLGDELTVVGGWRRDGATSEVIAENIPSERADALVVMAGTNDVRRELPVDALVANVAIIASAVQVEHVVIAAIPPEPQHTEAVRAANEALGQLALERGWVWIDPWLLYRVDEGWAANGTTDGVHGTIESYQYAGAAITAAVLEAVSPDTAG